MKSSRRRARACIGLLTALSMAIAACGGDDDAGDDTAEQPDDDTGAESGDDTGADGTADDGDGTADDGTASDTGDGTGGDGDGTAGDTDDGTAGDGDGTAGDGDIVLTASARGVTAETITIGYSYLDFEALKELGLTAAGWGDQEASFQAVVDDINAGGGIFGRTIEVVYEPYSPLGTEAAEAVCLRLTEDNEVFAVLGGFVGPAEPANTCIVGRGGTALVGGVQSEERLAEATAPWVTDRPLRSRQADVLFSLLDSKRELAGRTIAVVASIDAEDVRENVALKLREAGGDVVEVLQSEAAVGDIVGEDNVWATLAERIRGSGADTMLLVGNPGAGIRNAGAQGLDVDIWALDQESLTALGTSVSLEDARGTLAAAPLTGQDLWEHETMQVCRDALAASRPDVEVIDPADLQEGDEDWARGLGFGCRFLKLFETIALEAGPELTNESFAEAISSLTQFTIPGQPFASLGDKFDSNDSFSLVSFNPDIGADGGFDTITEVQDVTP